MRKLPLIAFVVGLSLGVGVAARVGVSAWLDWVNEPFRQPPSLQLGAVSRPPLVGTQPGQAPAQPTAVSATLGPVTRVRPTSTGVPLTEPSTSQPTATPPSAPTAAAPRSAPPALNSAAPTVATLTGKQRRVANTDGQGVALRDGPAGSRLPGKGYDEGEVVTTLEQQGEWTHIRGNDGREGWVLTVTLVP
jgi:hypothetical protein